ncbi:MAG: hypothetical protein KDE19_17295 [Caldilineaceae bacterium]|nr:hypothetical protein [Caldilineaceae bacterium]
MSTTITLYRAVGLKTIGFACCTLGRNDGFQTDLTFVGVGGVGLLDLHTAGWTIGVGIRNDYF